MYVSYILQERMIITIHVVKVKILKLTAPDKVKQG